MFDHTKIAFHWVNRLSFLVRKDLTARFRASGQRISAEEWAILLVLWKEGAQTPSVLADATIKDRTTVTRLIDTMVGKGIVERTEDPKDRRRSVVTLTDHGGALQDELIPVAQALIARASEGIPSEDIATTTRTLQAMSENLLGAKR